jgi:hypothetical protein
MLRANDGSDAIQTQGYDKGQNNARLEAHVVVSAGSVAHEKLSAEFQGKMVIDLQAALGLRLDPTPLLEGQPAPDLKDPIPMALALSLDLEAGTTMKVAESGVSSSTIALKGPTRITVHSGMQVDASTGVPVVNGLKGVNVSISGGASDIQSLVTPLGMSVALSTNGTSTVEIRDVDVNLLPNGQIQLSWGGVMVQLSAGSMTLGTPSGR